MATWPEFRRSTGRLAWLSHVRLLACDVEALRWIGLVAALVAVYLIGTHLSFPLADDSRVRDVVAASDLLAPMDAFLAGGATSRLGLFALGVLPLLIFYPSSLTMAGSRLRIQPRLSYGTLAALLVISALFSLWLVYLGALALAPWPLAAATAYWMLGILVLLKIEATIANHDGPDLVNLNAAVVAADYGLRMAAARNPYDLITVVLVIGFVVSFIYIGQWHRTAEIANIREPQVRRAALPLPASNTALRFGLLLLVFLLSLVTMTLVNLLFSAGLSPFGSSLAERTIVAASTLVVATLLIRNDLLDALLGQFNSLGTARRLKEQFWIVPGIEVGAATANYLRRQAALAHRVSYLFYMVWIVLIAILPELAGRLGIRLTEPPFGPLGFVMVLTLCAEIVAMIWTWWRGFVDRADFLAFWTPTPPTLAQETSLGSFGADDPFRIALEAFPPDVLAEVMRLPPEKRSPKEVAHVALAVARALRRRRGTVTARSVLVSLIWSIVWTVVVLVLVVWLVQIMLGSEISAEMKVNLLLFTVPLFLGWLIAFNLHADIPKLFGGQEAAQPGGVAPSDLSGLAHPPASQLPASPAPPHPIGPPLPVTDPPLPATDPPAHGGAGEPVPFEPADHLEDANHRE